MAGRSSAADEVEDSGAAELSFDPSERADYRRTLNHRPHGAGKSNFSRPVANTEPTEVRVAKIHGACRESSRVGPGFHPEADVHGEHPSQRRHRA